MLLMEMFLFNLVFQFIEIYSLYSFIKEYIKDMHVHKIFHRYKNI